MAYNDFLPSIGGFNPTPMSLSEIQNMKIPGLGDAPNLMQAPQGMLGDSNIPMASPLVQNAVQGAIAKPEDKGMSNADMMKMAGMAMQAFNKPQQQVQNPLQIISDKNQFRYAGFQQSPQQQMAQMLRQRG